MEDECIGIGFWVDGFGTVDMYCYIDENIELTEELKWQVRNNASRTMDRLFKVIENSDLIERVEE